MFLCRYLGFCLRLLIAKGTNNAISYNQSVLSYYMCTEQSGLKLEIICLKAIDFDMHKKTGAQYSRPIIMYICSYLA